MPLPPSKCDTLLGYRRKRMAKWCFQVLLAEIDAETEEDCNWYWPSSSNEPRPEFDSDVDALNAGKIKYPGCQIRPVPIRAEG